MSEPVEVRRVVADCDSQCADVAGFIDAGEPVAICEKYDACAECPCFLPKKAYAGDTLILMSDNTVRLVKAGEAEK